MEWLERHTTDTRSRHAADLFLRGRARWRDRVVARAYFTLAAPRWAAYEDSPTHLAPFLAGLERCRPPANVLDIGTGTGGAAAAVAARFPSASVLGVDTSRAMLRRARRRWDASGVTFRRASADRLPIDDGRFDLVVCVNAVPELGELRRVTVEGAEVLVAATTRSLSDETSPWVRRWRQAGFSRADCGEVSGGSWERYRR
jgi:SAM-dependent methyltransferase